MVLTLAARRDDGRQQRGQRRLERLVAAQGGGRLQDGAPVPARDAADEQADQHALVQQRRAGLHARAGQQEQAEDVVVDAQAQAGQEGHDDEADGQRHVQPQILDEAALLAEEVDLRGGHGHQDHDDDGQRGAGAGLLGQVVRG